MPTKWQEIVWSALRRPVEEKYALDARFLKNGRDKDVGLYSQGGHSDHSHSYQDVDTYSPICSDES